MQTTPAVSVVIPLYNKGPHIARALKSVLGQTFQDFEVIVVDDGSIDNGAAIVREFDDSRIRLIQQENQGVSAARNRGIEAAKAELVAFLDADDEWLPDFLETILKLRKKYPTAAAFATGVMEIKRGKCIHSKYIDIPKYSWDGLIQDYFRACFLGYPVITSSSVAIKKQVLKDLSGFKEGVFWGEDQDLWGRIALQQTIAFNNKICALIHNYRTNETLKNRVIATNIHPFLSTINKISLNAIQNYKFNNYFFLYIDSLRINSAHLNLINRDINSARKILAHSNTKFTFFLKMYLDLWILMPKKFFNIFYNLFNIGWIAISVFLSVNKLLIRLWEK